MRSNDAQLNGITIVLTAFITKELSNKESVIEILMGFKIWSV